MSRLSWIRAQREAIALMVRRAKDAGIALTGPDGLLKAVTAQIVEAVLDEELNEHLGYGKHDPVGRGGGNSRNGTRSKAVMTDNVGVVEIQVGQGLPGHDQALAQRLDRVVPFLDYDARDPHGRVLDERDRVGFPDTESEVRGLSPLVGFRGMNFLLETAAEAPLVPSWVMGALALLVLLGVIGWIVGFGSGRPHSK